jgi:glycosyltransferase involved in cell wall biosynthesis
VRTEFSIIVPVFNVEPYLSDFLNSLDAQTIDRRCFEVVFVDDCGTDNSLARIREWSNSTTVVTKILKMDKNRGQAAARNLGISAAIGDWIGFVDPDDYLENDYLQEISADLDGLSTVPTFLSTHLLHFIESQQVLVNRHPRRKVWEGENKSVLLSGWPDYSPTSPGFWVRRDLLLASGVLFSSKVKPNFEDLHFADRYLLSMDDPEIRYINSAKYAYRKRAANNSAINTASISLNRYTALLRYGYLDLLERAKGSTPNGIPRWLKNQIIYEISYILEGWTEFGKAHPETSSKAYKDFFGLLEKIREYLSVEDFVFFASRPLGNVTRMALCFGLSQGNWHSEYAFFEALDPRKKLLKLTYRFTGEPPAEAIRIRGKLRQPKFHKTTQHNYFGRTLLNTRSIWVPSDGAISLELDGKLIYFMTRDTFARPPYLTDAQKSPMFDKTRKL